MSTSDLVLTSRGLRFAGRYFPCTIGKGGISATKREGDMATPVGVHQVVQCLYRPDRVPPPNDWSQPIGLGDLWSDDSSDPDYNRMVQAPHSYGHEILRRADPLYDIVLVLDWNWPDAVANKGSAIFIHQWRRAVFPTAGCVALHPTHLKWIAQRIILGTRLVVT